MDWASFLSVPIALLLSLLLAFCISFMRARGQIDHDEDSLLFSNLVAVASIFLGIVLFLMTLAASKGATALCTPQTSSSITNNSIVAQNMSARISGCISGVSPLLSALGASVVIYIAALLMLSVIFRPVLYSDFENKSPREKFARGMIIWSISFLTVISALFMILIFLLYITTGA